MPLKFNPITCEFNITGSGGGNVSGPGTSTDRAIPTWNGTSGTSLQDNPAITIDSSGNLNFGAANEIWNGSGSIGVNNVNGGGSGDYRPVKEFVKEAVIVGSLSTGVTTAPYGVNNSSVTGMLAAGNLSFASTVHGGGNIFNSLNLGFYGFKKDSSFTNVPAFINLDDTTDSNVYFSLLHRLSAKSDLMKFGSDGSLTLLQNASLIANGYHLEASEFNAGNSSTAQTINWANGSAQLSTLTGNVVYTFSNPVAGGSYVLRIATGAGSFAATWPASVKWPGGIAPTITTTASKVDLINFYYDGTNYYGSFAQNY